MSATAELDSVHLASVAVAFPSAHVESAIPTADSVSSSEGNQPPGTLKTLQPVAFSGGLFRFAPGRRESLGAVARVEGRGELRALAFRCDADERSMTFGGLFGGAKFFTSFRMTGAMG